MERGKKLPNVLFNIQKKKSEIPHLGKEALKDQKAKAGRHYIL